MRITSLPSIFCHSTDYRLNFHFTSCFFKMRFLLFTQEMQLHPVLTGCLPSRWASSHEVFFFLYRHLILFHNSSFPGLSETPNIWWSLQNSAGLEISPCLALRIPDFRYVLPEAMKRVKRMDGLIDGILRYSR